MVKEKSNSSVKISLVYALFFISSAFMLLVAVVFSFYISGMERETLGSIQKHLLTAAHHASVYLTVDELDLFHTEEDMERPEWEEIRTRLQKFAEDTQVLYVYYWRYTGDGYIQYIIDNDEDEEYMVHPAMFFSLEADEISAEAALAIEAGKSWITDLGVYTDSWDDLLTAVVPVFNDDGTVYCGAGVDISDEVLVTMRSNIRIMRFMLIFSLLVSVLSGYLCMRSYNKKAIQSVNASLSKSQFLSTMSHEIRTPLNAVIGMTAIGKKAQEIDKKDRAFNKIENASFQLLGVINEVLDMAKIEANKLELSPVEFDFEKMLQKVVEVVSYRAEEKGQLLTVNIDSNVPERIVADDQHLAQVVTNLLSNAIKFTPENGRIELTAYVVEQSGDECRLRIDVADNGIGISPKQQSRLFKMYAQAEDDTSRKFGGTGLGLVISKRIVELMGGNIWVESELGSGARFIFTVKVLQKIRGQNYISENPDAIAAKSDDISHMDIRFDGKKMLIVEDIEINREIIVSILEHTGILIDSAGNGKEALDIIEAEADMYDIILMDVQMPVMDGLEATRRIRTLYSPQNNKPPIIAMTANAFKDDIEQCLEAGMNDHLSKPLDVERVFEVLRNYLS
ncbi:MAG: ATP-binding protein [Oscillospiraceae bacterium]|nr:ATP-binding protein [Oscillospiraceae bacterium]